MKKIILALTALVIVGCEYKNPDGSYDSSRNIDISTVAIDSCEYINSYNRLAHKGNCKYCAERRKQELRELIDSLKRIEQ